MGVGSNQEAKHTELMKDAGEGNSDIMERPGED